MNTFIGTANQARFSISNVKGENIVAICDTDKNYLDRAANDFISACTYNDYRELFDKWHAPRAPSMRRCRLYQ